MVHHPCIFHIGRTDGHPFRPAERGQIKEITYTTMKILLVCKSLPPAVIGGIQTHTWKLSEWLIRLGHEVSILTAGSWRGGIRSERRDGRECIAIPYIPGRKLPFLSKLAEEWAFNRAAQTWLRANAQYFDIVHLQGRSGFTFPGQQTATPVVATFHGLVSVENERSKRSGRPNWDTRWHEHWATYWERNTLRHADACIAVSGEMRREMEVVWPDAMPKTALLPNGVDLPPLQHAISPDTSNHLLFVGRLDRIKGLFIMIEAMKTTHPAIRLTIVGDGPDRSVLEAAIDSAGLRHRVTLTGALPQEKVYEHIHAAFALVLPSFHETQGIVLLEANACGKPVIASDIPGIREVVRQGETGWLFPVGNAQALASYINRTWAQAEESAALGQAGRHHVADCFAWEKIALETERLYGHVLAQKRWAASAAAPTWALC